MQYDDELIEIQRMGGCIFVNPVPNPTDRSGDVQRIRLCPKTKEPLFHRRILKSRAVEPPKFRELVCHFPWVRSHLCGI
jgi:hypothetical protein